MCLENKFKYSIILNLFYRKKNIEPSNIESDLEKQEEVSNKN